MAQVIFRHIQFSRGMLFLEDLAGVIRDRKIQESANKYKNDIQNKIELTPSHNVLKFNYCFNSNLKLEGSLVQPNYLVQKEETLEEIKKELTFECREEDEDSTKGMQFIKLNLSDSSENSSEVKENKLQTFTFNNSDRVAAGKDNDINSIIHEEREEMNESRLVSVDNEDNNSHVFKMNLLHVSQSSPSIVSSQRTGNIFNLRSI